MFKLNSKNNSILVSNFQRVIGEHRWMFFVFILWAVTFISLSEGLFTKTNTITVTGNSINTVKNEIAQFSLNIDSMNPDKAKAVETTNTKGSVIIDAIKNFGIPEEDIKTVNMNVYQQDKYENGTYVKGDWFAGMGLEVKVKDVDKVASFSELISTLDLSSFYGPNFMVDDSKLDQLDPLKSALSDAEEKASAIAKAMNKKLGEVVYFVEDSSSYNAYPMMYKATMSGGLGGGAAEVLPGTTQTYKSVTVTYKVK